jgi:hypothetical protein
MRKTKCAVADLTTAELHDLYQKHEYKEISEDNAISVCAGCGSWVARLDRENSAKGHEFVRLLPKDFGESGPFKLKNVMRLLSVEQRLSLAAYLTKLGYERKGAKHRAELLTYTNKEAAV